MIGVRVFILDLIVNDHSPAQSVMREAWLALGTLSLSRFTLTVGLPVLHRRRARDDQDLLQVLFQALRVLSGGFE